MDERVRRRRGAHGGPGGDPARRRSGADVLYLGGDSAVGMLPEGPVTKNGVIKGKGIGFKYLGYASIKYE